MSSGTKRSIGSSGNFNHAVSRSSELLSCAKTSWKIQQQRLQQQEQQQRDPAAAPPPPPISKPPDFRLSSPTDPPPQNLSMLEDGLTLLRAMEYGLKQLQILVRRRGHTNDPTQEIATLVKQLEQDTQELTEFCEQILKIRRRKQEKRHWELVVQWFQQVASQYSTQLQECLKLRGEILAEQAQQRRKLVDTNAGTGGTKKSSTTSSSSKRKANSAAAATPLFDCVHCSHSSPQKAPKSKIPPTNNINGNSNGSRPQAPGIYNGNGSGSTYYGGHNPAAAAASGGGTGAANNVGYGGGASAGYGGYGGGGYGGVPTATGMRQRKGGMSSNTSTIPTQELEEEEKVHTQIQMRQQKRQTQQRLDEARQAESMLGELGQLFGKMSTLISQQGETLEKIEDDVECALVDVTAGQEELTKLYSIKKGNRPLIIKTFSILIFLIIFMKAYHKK